MYPSRYGFVLTSKGLVSVTLAGALSESLVVVLPCESVFFGKSASGVEGTSLMSKGSAFCILGTKIQATTMSAIKITAPSSIFMRGVGVGLMCVGIGGNIKSATLLLHRVFDLPLGVLINPAVSV